jgi:serine/threonine-protein kinase
MASGAAASRYDTILKLASGGMATVFVGTVRGALGFRQLVAIKKPHPHLLDDPSFRSELVAEARLASMIHHANVVDVRDVEIEGDSISLVMDYIEGASLGDLVVAASRKTELLPVRVCVRIALDALAGLHAAHELVDERGRPVGLVHRDVSPQNILVGTDGIARVADFGVAKFVRKNREASTEGSLKGKLAYMAPEYVRGEDIDRRLDVFAMGVVLWETLCGKRCFRGVNEAETLNRILQLVPDPPSRVAKEAAPLDPVVACALAKAPEERFQNAAAMAAALEAAANADRLVASHAEVARTLTGLVGAAIEERRSLVRAKLANEPSVASLMGVPPIVAARASDSDLDAPATTVDAPLTLVSAPTTAAATPKMGGGQPLEPTVTMTDKVAPPSPSPSTDSGPYPPTGVAFTGVATTGVAFSAVPSTAPMTPRPQGGARTLGSGVGPVAVAAAPVAATKPSATPLLSNHAAHTLRSEAADTQLTFHEPSGRSFPAEARTTDSPELLVRTAKPARRWVAPVVVGIVVAATATGALVIASSRSSMSSASPSTQVSAMASAPRESTPVSTPVSTSTPVGPTVSATPTNAAPAETGSSKAVRPAPATSPTARPTSARPGGPPTTTPTASSTGTARKAPPRNPYDE